MSYYRTCPNCGAHLDPGERCDCRDRTKIDKEKAAPDATRSGSMEQVLTAVPIYSTF